MLVSTGPGGTSQILGEASRFGPARHGETSGVHLGGDSATKEGWDGVNIGSWCAVP